MNESKIDTKQIWYFGNNRAKNLRLSKPEWYAPFFLTNDRKYAEDYSDYGVYTITLKSEARSKILDFNNDLEVKKLGWPKKLIDEIRVGDSDLNGIAYDMYILAGHGGEHLWKLTRQPEMMDIAHEFDRRSRGMFSIVPRNATWAKEKDHRFVLQMWKDIHDAGFDGFTHIEFGKQVLALFNFQCMDKISIKPMHLSQVLESGGGKPISFKTLKAFAEGIDQNEVGRGVLNATMMLIGKTLSIDTDKFKEENPKITRAIEKAVGAASGSNGITIPLLAVHYPATDVSLLLAFDTPFSSSKRKSIKDTFKFIQKMLKRTTNVFGGLKFIPFKVDGGKIVHDTSENAYMQIAMTILLSDVEFDTIWPVSANVQPVMKYLDYICPSLMDLVGLATFGGGSIAGRAAKISAKIGAKTATKGATKGTLKKLSRKQLKLLAKLSKHAPEKVQKAAKAAHKTVKKAKNASTLSRKMKSNLKGRVEDQDSREQ